MRKLPSLWGCLRPLHGKEGLARHHVFKDGSSLCTARASANSESALELGSVACCALCMSTPSASHLVASQRRRAHPYQLGSTSSVPPLHMCALACVQLKYWGSIQCYKRTNLPREKQVHETEWGSIDQGGIEVENGCLGRCGFLCILHCAVVKHTLAATAQSTACSTQTSPLQRRKTVSGSARAGAGFLWRSQLASASPGWQHHQQAQQRWRQQDQQDQQQRSATCFLVLAGSSHRHNPTPRSQVVQGRRL